MKVKKDEKEPQLYTLGLVGHTTFVRHCGFGIEQIKRVGFRFHVGHSLTAEICRVINVSSHFFRLLGRPFSKFSNLWGGQIWNGKSLKSPRHATVEKLPQFGLGALGGEESRTWVIDLRRSLNQLLHLVLCRLLLINDDCNPRSAPFLLHGHSASFSISMKASFRIGASCS